MYLVVQYPEKKLRKLNPTSVLCFFQVFFFSHDGTDGTTHRCSDSPRIFPRHRQAHGARRRRPGALLGWGEALKKPAGRSRHLCGRAHRWRAGGGQKQPKKRRKRPRRQIRGPNRKSLGGRHGKYNARTCPNRPNAQKIKRRAALADRPKQNGVPGPVRKPLKLF